MGPFSDVEFFKRKMFYFGDKLKWKKEVEKKELLEIFCKVHGDYQKVMSLFMMQISFVKKLASSIKIHKSQIIRCESITESPQSF